MSGCQQAHRILSVEGRPTPRSSRPSTGRLTESRMLHVCNPDYCKLDVQGLAWPAAPAGHGSPLSLGADATSARYVKAGLGPSLPRARVCRCFLAGARGNPSSRAGFKRWHGAWGVSAKRRAGIKAQRRSTRAFAGRLPTVPAGRWCARRACWCGCQRRQGSSRRRRIRRRLAPASAGGLVNGPHPSDDFQSSRPPATSPRREAPWTIATGRQDSSDATI
jgi:hypothetical protein